MYLFLISEAFVCVCVCDLQVQMKDFRFSYKFKMACKEDVLRLCPNIKKKLVLPLFESGVARSSESILSVCLSALLSVFLYLSRFLYYCLSV